MPTHCESWNCASDVDENCNQRVAIERKKKPSNKRVTVHKTFLPRSSAASANLISHFPRFFSHFRIYLIVVFGDTAAALSPAACKREAFCEDPLYLLGGLSSKTNEMSRCGSLPAKFHHNKSPLAARESLMADFVC
jgi:hypothetical protein